MHSFFELHLVFLGLIAIVAGIIDTLAGGGGFITIPSLMLVGLPPAVVLGTNKLQASVGECNAAIHFICHEKIDIKSLLIGFLFTIVGSISGTIVVQYIHPEILNKFIPFLLLFVLIISLFSRKFVAENVGQQHLSFFKFYFIFGLLIGFYNGFLGPATGSFWVIAFVFFLGFDLKKATTYGKPLNFIGNLASLFCFIIAGLVNYKVALVMAVGQLIGTRVGVKLVVCKGVKIIRPAFIAMISVMFVILFIKYII